MIPLDVINGIFNNKKIIILVTRKELINKPDLRSRNKKKQKQEKIYLKTQFDDQKQFEHLTEEAEDNFLQEFRLIMSSKNKYLNGRKSRYPDNYQDWQYCNMVFPLRLRTSAVERLRRIYELFKDDNLDAKGVFQVVHRHSVLQKERNINKNIKKNKVSQVFEEFNIKMQNYPYPQFYDFKGEENQVPCTDLTKIKMPKDEIKSNHKIQIIPMPCDLEQDKVQ